MVKNQILVFIIIAVFFLGCSKKYSTEISSIELIKIELEEILKEIKNISAKRIMEITTRINKKIGFITKKHTEELSKKNYFRLSAYNKLVKKVDKKLLKKQILIKEIEERIMQLNNLNEDLKNNLYTKLEVDKFYNFESKNSLKLLNIAETFLKIISNLDEKKDIANKLCDSLILSMQKRGMR